MELTFGSIDSETCSIEDAEAAEAIYNHVMDGTHYQRQIDALRSLGMHGNAAREIESLRKQGVQVV
jgi:hypothetical protein